MAGNGNGPLTDEQCQQAYQAFIDNNHNKTHAAKALGMGRKTYTNRLKVAFSRNIDGRYGNLIVPEGNQILSETQQFDKDGALSGASVKIGAAREEEFQLPPGHAIKGVSVLTDATGRTMQTWTKTHAGERSVEDIVGYLKNAFEGFVRPEFDLQMPSYVNSDIQTLYPLPDLHLGLFAWGKEAGQDWDLKIGVAKYHEAMQQVAEASPNAETALLLGGGDLLHMDNTENRTMKSGNVLDVDTRYSKVLDAACDLLVHQVELLLTKHENVIVRLLPGNHDEHSTPAMTYTLRAWYRNVDRVHVDVDPSWFWWHRFGKTLLGATHGDKAKLPDMPLIMANRVPEEWGATVHRYVHGFHVHHATKAIFEGGGCIAESHQAPVAQDAYHSSKAYLSGQSLQSITYHTDRGEIARAKVAL